MRKIVASACRYKSTFGMKSLAHGDSAFVAPRQAKADQGGVTTPVYTSGFYRSGIAAKSRAARRYALLHVIGPRPGCNTYVRKLVQEQKYTYVPNMPGCVVRRPSVPSRSNSDDLRSYAQVFTDAEEVIYGVKPPQPPDAKWPEHMDYLYKKLQELRKALDISADENCRHGRGAFKRFTCGTSHGGGQVVRTVGGAPRSCSPFCRGPQKYTRTGTGAATRRRYGASSTTPSSRLYVGTFRVRQTYVRRLRR